MSFPSLDSKRRRIRQDLCPLFPQCERHFWEPQVVTDAQPNSPSRGEQGCHELGAWRRVVALHQDGSVGDVDVKEVDLAVGGDNVTVVVDQHVGVVEFALVGALGGGKKRV